MSDRALNICIGLSLAIHLIVSLGLSGARWTATSVRPPPATPPVRLRLAGAATEAERADAPRPDVSAAPPRTEPARNRAPKKKPAPQPEPAAPVMHESVRPEPAVEATAAPAAPTELAALDVEAESSAESFVEDDSSASTPDRSAESGASGEEEADLLARYVEAIRARVQDRKRYPPLARKRAVEGRIVARIAIRADGSLDAIEFDDDSPPLLRRATDEAIRSAGPYAAPPAGAITIELPVEYSLRDAS